MQRITIHVEVPKCLHNEFKKSMLRQHCTTDSEAVRTLIRSAIESEKSSLKETTGNRANNGEYQNGQ